MGNEVKMRKHEIMARIERVGVVAVVRAESEERAFQVSKACMAGGIDAIEVTYTVPGATEVIKNLVEKFGQDLLVGAGTVLDSETARTAILAGANYIVSPGFDKATAKLCNRYQVPYMPGCMTITEMIQAMEYGAAVVKLFPGSAFGPDFVKAVKGPLPQAEIMPTGGVSLENAKDWIRNGCIAVGVGGSLTKGSSEDIEKTARAFVAAVSEGR